jgi:hypothetical protein
MNPDNLAAKYVASEKERVPYACLLGTSSVVV